jgi:MoxR-like ATPase
MGDTMFGDLASTRDGLRDAGYLADDGIASVVYLAEKLGKPVLVEGPAGTGKTELAKAVAAMTDARLIRLQCYEGLDEAKALYEWNYKKQLLRIQADRGSDANNEEWVDIQDDIFNDEFLLTRPLLEAITADEWKSKLKLCCWKFCPSTKFLFLNWAQSKPHRFPSSSLPLTTLGNFLRHSSGAACSCTSTTHS